MCSGVPSSEKIMASLHFRGPDQTRHSLSRAAPVTAFGALLNLQRIGIASKWSFSSSSELWPPWLSPFLSVSKSNSSSPCHKSKNWESVSPDETWYYKPVRANSHVILLLKAFLPFPHFVQFLASMDIFWWRSTGHQIRTCYIQQGHEAFYSQSSARNSAMILIPWLCNEMNEMSMISTGWALWSEN